jgi:hypothetical protein
VTAFVDAGHVVRGFIRRSSGTMRQIFVVLFNRLHRVSVADVDVVFQEGLMWTIIGYE